jgi:hypothetical protein
MYTLARFLQLAGLTIPILAIFAQLNQTISVGQMLGFLIMAVMLFLVGRYLQGYTGGSP